MRVQHVNHASDNGPDLAHVLAAEAAMPSKSDLPALYKTLDELWTRRDDPEVLRLSERLVAEGLRHAGDDVGLLWRAARFHYWRSDLSDDVELKQSSSEQGWAEAERALAHDPECADARYWAAAACGTYAEAIGVLAALARGLEAKLRKNLDWTVERSAGYDRGGPLLILGRYWAQLPWPKRDRKKAYANLRAVLARHPENLRARLYLAEALHAEGGGQRREAMTLVEEILSAAPGGYDAPEERLVQRRASALKPEIEREL
ncbi:MAG: hypothetical protein HY901_25920 [Deltaproteobacteria bacterium]|nr:hypothetical protein [Deltaproteobacteria bacterium]